ncbi:hypothetical protein BDV93DRAFT_548098 [Ceratobasidium sp. AG-I]|nr:hypothetical protein BDV93DRAFT_548098 [Ceratobasidium sp. AG-I]
MASSSRNLIVLCDGTGKNGAIQELSLQTNIWRLSKMIDNENGRHLVKYVHGVGSNKQTRGLPARLLGSTVVKQVMAAYMWIVLHYKPGDNICSKSSFVDCLVSHPEEFMRYWSSLEHKLPGNRNSVPEQTTVVPIKFLVVWDTVAAVRSTETLREQINLLGIRDDEIPANVEKTLHIVAYHENRRLFDVTLFNQKSNDPRCIQICFSGAHSDVGGGHGHRLHCTLPDVTHNWVVDHISPIIKVERIETTTQAYNLDPDDAYHNSPWWKRIPDKWEPRKQLTRKSWLVAHETLETLKLPDNSKLLKYWGELVSLRRRVTGAIQRGFTLIGRQANLPLVQSETKPPRLAHFTQAPKTADAPSDINDRNRRVPPLHVVWNMPATSVEHDHNVTSAENPAPWLTTTPVSIPRVSAVPDNYTANTGLQHDPLKLHITCESPVDEESSSLPHPASPYSPENLHSNSKLDKPTPASAPQVIEVKVHPVAQMRIRLAPPPPPLTRRPAVSIRGPRAVPPPPTKKVIPLAESPFVTPVLVLDTRRAECASKQTDMPPRPAVMSGPRVPPLPPRPPKELPAKSSTEKFPSAGYSPVCSAPPAYSLVTPAFPPLKTTGSPGAPPLPPRPQQQQLQSSIPTSLRAGFHQGTLSTTKDALPPTIDTSYDKAPKTPPLPPRPRTTIIAPPLPPQTTSIALDPYINTPSSTPSSFMSFPTPYLTICGDNLISPYPNSPFYPQSSSSYTSSEAPWTPANYQYGSPQVPYGGAPAFQMPVPTIPLFFNQFPSQTSSFGNSAPPVTASPWEDAKNGIAGETPYVPYSEYCNSLFYASALHASSTKP